MSNTSLFRPAHLYTFVDTFSFPQDRITDHRVGLSITGVDRVLSGENLDTIVTELMEDDRAKRLEGFLKQLAAQ